MKACPKAFSVADVMNLMGCSSLDFQDAAVSRLTILSLLGFVTFADRQKNLTSETSNQVYEESGFTCGFSVMLCYFQYALTNKCQ